MSSHGEQLAADLDAARAAAGEGWNREQRIAFYNSWLTRFAVAKRREAKPKAPVSEEAQSIYQLYPKKVGKTDALRAISGVLTSGVGADALREKVALYAKCVRFWPDSYRTLSDGGDRCPFPGSWFRAGRYEDDPKEWWGPRGEPKETIYEASVKSYPEPKGWREQFPESIYKSWSDVPQSSKAHICAAMKLADKMLVPAETPSRPGLLFPDA